MPLSSSTAICSMFPLVRHIVHLWERMTRLRTALMTEMCHVGNKDQCRHLQTCLAVGDVCECMRVHSLACTHALHVWEEEHKTSLLSLIWAQMESRS